VNLPAYKDITFTESCGKQTLTPTPGTYQLEATPGAAQTLEIETSSYFQNSDPTLCPITVEEIVDSNNDVY